MDKNKKYIYSLALIPLIAIIFLFGWFFTIIFEGEKPVVTLDPLPEFLSTVRKFNVNIADKKRGLKKLLISVNQESREITVLEKKFPFSGFMNNEGVHQHSESFSIDPATIKLAQGRVDLKVRVWDYSRRGGGDGNLTLIDHKMIVDNIPPAIRAVSRMHNINMGGAGLVVYQASSDTEGSGVYVDDQFFQGFPSEKSTQKGLYICYFGLPSFIKEKPVIYLWAKDKAGNISKVTFYYHLRKKRFRRDKINITDRFLKRVLPYFSFYPMDSEANEIEKYLKVNTELRKENHETFLRLMKNTSPEKKWSGKWLRMKNAAAMARYGDRRSYYYKGEKIDEQFHLGADLASLPNSPIQAANNGLVIFAGRNGIYGLTVVLDHGQGLASVYSHMSEIFVKSGQDVNKGDSVGLTGKTGLAGGDHLHFAVMVNGVFVNPIEWWDSHWIKDNINKKLALLK